MQPKTITFKNFKKCLFKEELSSETDGRGCIMLFMCSVFFDSLTHITNESRPRETKNGSVDVESYPDDVTSIDLANVEKHIKAGGLLDWAKKIYSGGSSSSALNVSVIGPI